MRLDVILRRVSRAQRSTSRALTPVFAGYGGALQTRDRSNVWRSWISGAPLHFASRCAASGTRRLRQHDLSARLPVGPDRAIANSAQARAGSQLSLEFSAATCALAHRISCRFAPRAPD